MSNFPKELCCAKTEDLLCLPVVTLDGIAYSYLSLFEMFMESQGRPTCVVTQEPIEFFPAVCVALHHYLWDKYKVDQKTRRGRDEKVIFDKYGFQMPNISERPDDDTEEGFEEEMHCTVDDELAFEPCCLSSGSIVSAHNVPENGFKKDPNRFFACALHGQVPRRSPTLEYMIKDMFPVKYAELAREVPPAKAVVRVDRELSSDQHLHIGMGCDGCGMWPIIGRAWIDPACPEPVGYHLCDGCYNNGVHKRVITGRFNQTHMPKNQMVEVFPGAFF